jgi:hypothetical protein
MADEREEREMTEQEAKARLAPAGWELLPKGDQTDGSPFDAYARRWDEDRDFEEGRGIFLKGNDCEARALLVSSVEGEAKAAETELALRVALDKMDDWTKRCECVKDKLREVTVKAERLRDVIFRAATFLGALGEQDGRYEAVMLIRQALAVLKEVDCGG